MKILINILAFIGIFFAITFLILFRNFNSYVQDSNSSTILDKTKYENLLKNIKGKNFINDQSKIFIVREFVVTQNMKTTGIAVLNGKNKNYKNKSIKELKAYSPEKIYITQIGDIKLKGFITVDNLSGNTILFSNVNEKEKKNKKEEGK